MRYRSRLALAACAATAVLALAAGSAFARRLELSTQAFLIGWGGAAPLVAEAGGSRVSCAVSLEGSFHSRTLSKVCGELAANVFEAGVRECNGGEATVLFETLPWHVQYNSFTGTLPSITSLTTMLVGAAIRISVGGVECLARTSGREPWFTRFNMSSGRITSVESLGEHTIALGGGFLCEFGGAGRLTGTGTLTRDDTTVAITVRLVA
jgi:hypothetical protein